MNKQTNGDQMKELAGKFRKEDGLLSYEIFMPYDDVFFDIVFKVGRFKLRKTDTGTRCWGDTAMSYRR